MKLLQTFKFKSLQGDQFFYLLKDKKELYFGEGLIFKPLDNQSILGLINIHKFKIKSKQDLVDQAPNVGAWKELKEFDLEKEARR